MHIQNTKLYSLSNFIIIYDSSSGSKNKTVLVHIEHRLTANLTGEIWGTDCMTLFDRWGRRTSRSLAVYIYIYIYICVCVCVCICIYIYIYIVLFGPVKPELGVIPSG